MRGASASFAAASVRSGLGVEEELDDALIESEFASIVGALRQESGGGLERGEVGVWRVEGRGSSREEADEARGAEDRSSRISDESVDFEDVELGMRDRAYSRSPGVFGDGLGGGRAGGGGARTARGSLARGGGLMAQLDAPFVRAEGRRRVSLMPRIAQEALSVLQSEEHRERAKRGSLAPSTHQRGWAGSFAERDAVGVGGRASGEEEGGGGGRGSGEGGVELVAQGGESGGVGGARRGRTETSGSLRERLPTRGGRAPAPLLSAMQSARDKTRKTTVPGEIKSRLLRECDAMGELAGLFVRDALDERPIRIAAQSRQSLWMYGLYFSRWYRWASWLALLAWLVAQYDLGGDVRDVRGDLSPSTNTAFSHYPVWRRAVDVAVVSWLLCDVAARAAAVGVRNFVDWRWIFWPLPGEPRHPICNVIGEVVDEARASLLDWTDMLACTRPRPEDLDPDPTDPNEGPGDQARGAPSTFSPPPGEGGSVSPRRAREAVPSWGSLAHLQARPRFQSFDSSGRSIQPTNHGSGPAPRSSCCGGQRQRRGTENPLQRAQSGPGLRERVSARPKMRRRRASRASGSGEAGEAASWLGVGRRAEHLARGQLSDLLVALVVLALAADVFVAVGRGGQGGGGGVGRMCQVLQPVLVVLYSEGLRQWSYLLIRLVPKIVETLALISLVVVLFAASGVLLFSGLRDEMASNVPGCCDDFSSFLRALLTTVVLATAENYPDVMAAPRARVGGLAVAWFVVSLVVYLFVLGNLLVPLLFRAFRRYRRELAVAVYVHQRRALMAAFLCLDVTGSGRVHYPMFERMIARLRPALLRTYDGVGPRLMLRELKHNALQHRREQQSHGTTDLSSPPNLAPNSASPPNLAPNSAYPPNLAPAPRDPTHPLHQTTVVGAGADAARAIDLDPLAIQAHALVLASTGRVVSAPRAAGVPLMGDAASGGTYLRSTRTSIAAAVRETTPALVSAWTARVNAMPWEIMATLHAAFLTASRSPEDIIRSFGLQAAAAKDAGGPHPRRIRRVGASFRTRRLPSSSAISPMPAPGASLPTAQAALSRTSVIGAVARLHTAGARARHRLGPNNTPTALGPSGPTIGGPGGGVVVAHPLRRTSLLPPPTMPAATPDVGTSGLMAGLMTTMPTTRGMTATMPTMPTTPTTMPPTPQTGRRSSSLLASPPLAAAPGGGDVEGLKRAMSAADSLTLKEFFGILHVIQHSYKPVQADGDLARDVETSALLSHGCTRLALSVPLVAGIAMAGVFAVSVRAAAVGCLVLAALGIVEKAVLAYYLGWLSFYRRQAERFDSALVAIALALAIAATAAPALQDAHTLAALAVFALLVRALRILVLFRAFRRILLTISSIASYLAMALSLVALVLFLFSVIGTRLFGDLVPRFLARWDQGCAIVCPSPSSAPIPLTSCVPILLSTPHNRSDSTYMSLTATAAHLLPSPSPSTPDAFSLSFTLSSPSNLTLSSGDLFLLTGCSASAALQCPNGPSSTNNAPPYPSSIPLDSFSLSLSSISSSSTPSSPPFAWAVGGDVVSPLHPSSGSPLHPPSTPPSSRSSLCGARVAVEAPGFLTDAGSMRSLGDASLALFQMLVSSNWHEIIYTNLFAGADPAATLAFFLAFYTVSVAVTFNLVIAIFIDAFETAHEQVYDKDHAMRFLIDRHVPIRAKAARVSGPRDLVYKIKGHDNPTLLAALLEDGERDRIVSAALARASDAVRQNAHSRTD